MTVIVKNYGFLWERKHFYRGAGSNKGELLGYAKGAKTRLILESKSAFMFYTIKTRTLFMLGRRVMGTRHCLVG